jgi:hypothetical protein
LGNFLSAFNISRQALAFSIFAFACCYLQRKKYLFWILAAAAISIHLSALIPVLVITLLELLKPKLRTVSLLALLAVSLGALLTQIPQAVEIASRLSPRYSEYLANGSDSGIGTYLIALFTICLLTLSLVLAFRAGDESIWLKFALFGPVFLIFGTQVIELGRLALYFNLGLIIALPRLLKNIKHSLALSMFVWLASMVFFLVYLDAFGDLLPYRL